jgi:F-type H+-transporting ATPase subunit delta
MSDTIATVYAQALFQACETAGTIDSAWDELNFLKGFWKDNSDFRSFMNNPSIEKANKQNMLDKVFKDLEQELVKNFLGVLVKKGRIGHLVEAVAAYETLVNEKAGKAFATVVSAASLDESSKAGIVEKLTKRFGKKIVLQEEVDPSLLGGFIVRVGDTVIDGSVKRNVAELAKTLSATSTSVNVWENN